MDDGGLQRLRYTLQPDGAWAHETLDRVLESDGEAAAADADNEGSPSSELGPGSASFGGWATAEGPGGNSDQAIQLLSSDEIELVPSVGVGWNAATPPYGCASHTSTQHIVSRDCTSNAGAVVEATEAPDVYSDTRLLLAQGLLGGGHAGDAEVVAPGDGTARAGAPGAVVRESGQGVVMSTTPAARRSVQQSARTAAAAPSIALALQMPDVLVGIPSPANADAGTPFYQTVVELESANSTQGAQPCVDTATNVLEPPAPQALRFRARPLGRIGGLSELRVEQAVVQHQASGPAGRVGAWSLVIRCEQALESAAFRDSDAAADEAGVAAGPRPHLVDVSLWRGHDLLAARVVLLVPPECCGLPPPQQPSLPAATASPAASAAAGVGLPRGSSAAPASRWVGELLQVLQGQSAAGAQHLLVDMGLLLSGALDEVAAGSAPQQAPQGRAEPGQRCGVSASAAASAAGRAPGPGSAIAGLEAVLSRRLRAAQQTLLVLDMGSSLLSLVLQVSWHSPAVLGWPCGYLVVLFVH